MRMRKMPWRTMQRFRICLTVLKMLSMASRRSDWLPCRKFGEAVLGGRCDGGHLQHRVLHARGFAGPSPLATINADVGFDLRFRLYIRRILCPHRSARAG